ncbi:MAG: tRNA lysidine(34) synthetase TilS [Vicinamibacterales bacterium]|nr:tRNA lysidine(34) synthetase TilS [Vicinamibacterales bacterium]
MSLIETTRRTIRRHQLLEPGARVLVALSGGADSVALLLALREMATSDGFEVVGAAHLNHQLRGVDADKDEAFCERLAAACAVPLDAERVDVACLARAAGTSIENAAHGARHDFFARAAARLGATAVAVAHTLDDQAETFLLRLLRGAGPRGLGGMHPRSGLVVRPFLECTRADVRAFLEHQQAGFREDASNADLDIPRNRIRHELIPYLRQRFSPGISEVLHREAEIARDDSEFLEQAASVAARSLLTLTPEGVEIDASGLLVQPRAIARRVVRDAQQTASGGRFVGFEAVEAVLAFAVSNASGPLDLPGHRVNRRDGRIVLSKSHGRPKRRLQADFTYELELPGQVGVPEAGCAISACADALVAGESPASRWVLTSRGDQVVVEAGQLAHPLTVRNRRPGDRFRPLGLQGHKKLQDFFVDAKVRRNDRDTIPLVVDSAGQIVWVAGHAVAEDFRVTDRTRAVVILKRLPGGTG